METNTPQTTATQKLINELADDKALVEQAIATYKAEGAKGLIKVLPGAVQEITEDAEAAIAAVPEIKAGYKTTEFWLAVAVFGVNAGFLVATGKGLPLEVNAALAGITAIYIAIRGVVKAKQA